MLFRAILAAGLFAIASSPAASQVTRSDYAEFIRNAQAAEDVYLRLEQTARAEIAALDDLAGYYVLQTSDGGYTTISFNEASRLGDQFLLLREMSDGQSGTTLLEGLSLSPQLRAAVSSAINAIVNSAEYQSGALDVDTRNILLNTFLQALHDNLNRVSQSNWQDITARREALQQNIRDSEAMRDELGRLVEEALSARAKAPTESAQAGYISEEGYYVVRKSGAGWIKGGQGNAIYASGHSYFTIWGDEDRAEPSKQYYWEFPIGFRMGQQFSAWRSEAEEDSRRACRELRPLGRVSEPHIWTDGPHYEIVYGPSASRPPISEFGTHRALNGAPDSSKQWSHESGDIEEVQAVCRDLGEPFGN